MAQEVLTPGATFAGHKILQTLGSGGMGSVYLAQHPNLPRLVAMKVLARALTDDEEIRERFLLEAEHAARLEHPNIVTVYDRGNCDGRLWLSMQYIDGTDAAMPLKSGPLPMNRVTRIISETAKALDYAHELGILHRDVKPANILLSSPTGAREERVYLADFGIAKALDDTRQLTASGMFAGSLQYAAPEQFDTESELDQRTDVYALGCTLYHLVSGSVPYPGKSPAQWMHGHISARIPKPTQTRPPQFGPLPGAIDEVVKRALAKNREDRYQTCGALSEAMLAAVASEKEPARNVRIEYREPPTLPPAPLFVSPPEPVFRPPTQPPRPPTFPPTSFPLPPQRPPSPQPAPPPQWVEPAVSPAPVGPPPASSTPKPSSRKRTRVLIALFVVLVIAGSAALAGFWLLSSDAKPELALMAADEPGDNPFMQSAVTAAWDSTDALPALPESDRNGAAIVALPITADAPGFYAGVEKVADCDREQISAFLASNAKTANVFAAALDSDGTLYWAGGQRLSSSDLRSYVGELTPARLRFDTRATHHALVEGDSPGVQAVFEAGTAVLVDATGLPRVRCVSGSPITSPVAMSQAPTVVGRPWAGYRPGALAVASRSEVVMTSFTLADLRSGTAFERPAGTDGSQDRRSSIPIGTFGS